MKAFLFPMNQVHPSHHIENYFVIGSGDGCHWQDPDFDERHARIEVQKNPQLEFVLRDLKSKSGVLLNGQNIREAVLRDGDWIQVENQLMMFSLFERRKPIPFKITSRNESWNTQLGLLGNVAQTDFPVLILGPSGSGKEVIAQEIHRSSSRAANPFVAVNCCALTENLIESELFGHVRGSFTGAVTDRKGAFEAARGGTLFLDEIGDLPSTLQAKLLRALENNEIRPVGSDQTIKINVRILAATHQNLIEKIHSGMFRSDLYYRLNVIKVKVPTLFDRSEDFEDLFMYFAKEMRVRFSHLAIARFKKHTWPGNIRELRNTIARAKALYPQELIDENIADHLLDKMVLSPQKTLLLDTSPKPLTVLKEMERQLILKKLATYHGNQRLTATDLGIPKSTLHDRLRTYCIDPKSFARSALPSPI